MDRGVRLGAGLLAGAIPVALGSLAAFILVDALPTLHYMGLSFLTGTEWNLGNQYAAATGGAAALAGASFGILPYVLGTLATSFLALLLAVPFGLGTAIFLSEWAPRHLQRLLGSFVELLAGVPSVVYGLFGLVVVVPLVGHDVGPWLARYVGFLPFLAGPVGTGMGLLAAAMVLAIMILPFIAATSRDAMMAVPPETREAATALGLTGSEVVATVVLPVARPAILGSIILALGRALGETMAVLMVSGGAMNLLPQNLYGPVNTMAALIAAQLDSAFTDPTHMALHALAAVALTLFAITLVVNAAARLLIRWEGR